MITKPLYNILVLIYNGLPWSDLGVAIIILTILVKIIMYPLSVRAIKSQEAMKVLQPKIKEIQKKYKNDKEKQAKELLNLYKEYGINPLSGIWPLFIQLPVLFGLYRVFLNDFSQINGSLLYSFIEAPQMFNTTFLGLVDLSGKSAVLAVMAGILQFIQMKMSLPKNGVSGKKDFSSALSKQMLIIMPVFITFIGFSLPAALPLYWVISTLFGIIQQYILTRKKVCPVSQS